MDDLSPSPALPGSASPLLDWNVAVYCMNEHTRLAECLRRITVDLEGRRAIVTVIINGSTDASLAIAQAAAATGQGIEIYTIAAADKANAINQFIHHLRHPARFYGEVDGYAHIAPGSFGALERRLDAPPHPRVVSGTCSNGRSMKLMTEQTLKVGGLNHGQFHAFPADFLDRMVADGIRLPTGLYRGDGLLGTMAAHDLDPRIHPWDNARVAGAEGASYEIPQGSYYRFAEIKRQYRRKIRQQQGRMEALAIKHVIERDGFQGLPHTMRDLLLNYIARHGRPPAKRLDRIFQKLALRNLARMRPVEAAGLVPWQATTAH